MPDSDSSPTATDSSFTSRGPSLLLTETEIADGWREILVEGELDLAVAEQLDRLLDTDPGRHTLIDLGACEFLDSTGIAVILRARRRAEESDGILAVHSPHGQVRRVLEISGLIGDGLVFTDREALADMQRHRTS